MQKYHETVISSIGRPVIGAAVRVTTLAGATATIYSDNGITPIASLVTDATGAFGFYAADGRYTITISGTNFPTRVISDVLLEDPADVAASSGSSLVGFQFSAVGEVTANLQTYLRNALSVHVERFGADPTGVADSRTPFNDAITCAALFGAEVKCTPGATYKTSGTITLKLGIVGIDLNGATMKPSAGNFEVFAISASKQQQTGQSVALTADSYTVALPSGCTAVEGDIVRLTNTGTPRISTTSPSDPSYLGQYFYGALTRIVKLSGLTATVSHAPAHTFTADEVEVYSSAHNARIRNGRIDARAVTDAKGIYGTAANVEIENLQILGSSDDEGLFGVSISGINCKVSRCYIDGFIDATGSVNGRLGYGIQMAGHNMVSEQNAVFDCKHCFTTSDRRFWSESVFCLYNTAVHRAGKAAVIGAFPPVDTHANLARFVMIGCPRIEGISALFNFRNGSAVLIGNTMSCPTAASSQTAIWAYEEDVSRLVLSKNKITLTATSTGSLLRLNDTAATLNVGGVSIDDNDFSGGEIRLENTGAMTWAGNIDGLSVTNNRLRNCPNNGIRLQTSGTAQGMLSRGNTYWYGNVAFGVGIRTDIATISDVFVIDGDTFIAASRAGATEDAVRIASGSGRVLPTNCKMNRSIQDVTATFAFKWTGNTLTDSSVVTSTGTWKNNTSIRGFDVYKNAAPSGATWALGDRVINSAPAVGSPKAWTATVAGTPGTWVSEGNL